MQRFMGGKKTSDISGGGQSIWDNKKNKFTLSSGDKTPGGKKNDYGTAEGSSAIKRGGKNVKSSSFKQGKSNKNGPTTNIKIQRQFND